MSHSIVFNFSLFLFLLAKISSAILPTNYLNFGLGSDGILLGINHPDLFISWGIFPSDKIQFTIKANANFETYFTVPNHDPRPFMVQAAILGGYKGLLWDRDFCTSIGIGSIYGLRAGEKYFDHRWSGSLFSERTIEQRGIRYVDISFPFQIQWVFTTPKEPFGIGIDLSGLYASEDQRWSLGFFFRFRHGRNPPIQFVEPQPNKGKSNYIPTPGKQKEELENNLEEEELEE